MKERRNYLKRAFYHLMKIEMKKNKKLAFDGYHETNARLAKLFTCGEPIESSVIFVEDDMLCITDDFFRLRSRERDAITQFFADSLNDQESKS